MFSILGFDLPAYPELEGQGSIGSDAGSRGRVDQWHGAGDHPGRALR